MENSTNRNKEIRRLHNQLLYKTLAVNRLHKSVNGEIDFKTFKGNCRDFLTDPLSIGKGDAEQLLEELEKQKFIGIGDYDNLKKLVEFNVEYIDRIEETERAILSNGGTIYQRNANGELMEDNGTNRGKLHVHLGTVHLIFRGGGAWVFYPGQDFFCSYKIGARFFFFAGPDYFFFMTESYIYNI